LPRNLASRTDPSTPAGAIEPSVLSIFREHPAEPKEKAYLLAASGAISDTAIDYADIAFFSAGLLLKRYPELLMQRYGFLKTIPKDELTLIEKIGTARGCLKKGGAINYQKASEAFIRELRSGKIGKISFETPKDFEHDHETEKK